MNREQAQKAEECLAQELIRMNIVVTPYVYESEPGDWNEEDILMTRLYYSGWKNGGEEILCFSNMDPDNMDSDDFDRNFIGIFGQDTLSSITVTPYSFLNRNRGKLWSDIQTILQKRLQIKAPTLYLRLHRGGTAALRLLSDLECKTASTDVLIQRWKLPLSVTNGDVNLRVETGEDYKLSACFSNEVINRIIRAAL